MKPMLAEDVVTFEALTYPLYGSFKIDGVRALMPHTGSEFKPSFLPRSLKQFKNAATVAHFNKLGRWLAGMDGELTLGPLAVGEALCRLTSGAMNTIEGEPEIHWWVFDLIDAKWEADGFPFDKRVKILAKKFAEIPTAARKAMRVHLVEQRLLKNATEAEAMEQEAIALGYEGLVLKSPDGVYKFGRSTLKSQQFLRVKRFTDGEGEIVGFEEQQKNNNEATTNELGHTTRSSHKANKVGKATLGVLLVKMINGKFKGKTVRVMGGWDAAEGLKIWRHQKQYLGQLAKVKYFGHGCKDLPRFTTYLGLRDKSDLS